MKKTHLTATLAVLAAGLFCPLPHHSLLITPASAQSPFDDDDERAVYEAWDKIHFDIAYFKNDQLAGRATADKAIQSLEPEIAKLEAALKGHPDLKTRVVPGQGMSQETGGQLLELAQKFVSEARQELKKSTASDAQAGTKEILAARSYLTDGMKSLADARAEAKTKPLESHEDYDRAASFLGTVINRWGNVLKASPELASFAITFGGKKTPVGELQKLAMTSLEQARAERSKVYDRALAAGQAMAARAASTLAGGRKQTYQERGMPTYWEGSNQTDDAARLKALKTAGAWRYDVYTGNDLCQITYHFRGDAVTRIERTPPWGKG